MVPRTLRTRPRPFSRSSVRLSEPFLPSCSAVAILSGMSQATEPDDWSDWSDELEAVVRRAVAAAYSRRAKIICKNDMPDKHEMVDVPVPGGYVIADAGIAPLIAALCAAGVDTMASCQQTGCDGLAYIQFFRLPHARQFHRILGQMGINAMPVEPTDWSFGDVKVWAGRVYFDPAQIPTLAAHFGNISPAEGGTVK